MKKLNITKEQFNRSNYFQKKYGKLEYVSESGRLKFNEAEENVPVTDQEKELCNYIPDLIEE